jgi:PAS domain S-box-containing protein
MTKLFYPESELKANQLENQALRCDRANEDFSIALDALNSTVSGVVITNLEGKIRYVNPAFLRIFGYRNKAELLGKNAAELFAIDKVRKLSDVQTIIDGNKGETEEFEVHRQDGTTFFVEMSSSNVTDHKGQTVGRMASFVDISGKKEAQRKLEKTNQELEAFVRLVSHEMKTRITAVEGFTEVLLESYLDKLDEKGGLCAQRIMANAKKMEVLVNDLLALSRVGEIALILKPVFSSGVVGDVIANLQNRLDDKGIDLVKTRNLPLILCDEKWIAHVFENLLVNAIKFMGENPSPKIEIGYFDYGEAHCFFVSDNGIGIDTQEQHKIFERFYCVKDIEDECGTGLGLTIVERIIKSHGGKVWVESKKGEGATFYFTLPKAIEPD